MISPRTRSGTRNAAFRMTFLQSFWRTKPRSPSALRKLNSALLEDESVARLPGARMYSPSTLRGWVLAVSNPAKFYSKGAGRAAPPRPTLYERTVPDWLDTPL